jgi:hypothetical protein
MRLIGRVLPGLSTQRRDDLKGCAMDEDEEPGSPRNAFIALIVVVVLIAGGLWVTHVLHSMAAIQDCATSGRTNCAPVGQK